MTLCHSREFVGYNLRAPEVESSEARLEVHVKDNPSMKKIFAILTMTLAFSFSLSAQEHSPRPAGTPRPATPSSTPPAYNAMDTSGWVKFTSDQGHFSVLMPEIPEDKTETTPSAQGPYTTHLFIVKDAT